jgi:putative transposase
VAFQTEFEEQILHHDGGEIGIDLGVTQFATLSTGEKIESPRPLKKYEKKLAAAQRAMARRKKGGKNWTQQKYLVQRIHKKIGDIRRDFLHKTSHELCKNHAKIVIEDLKVSNMSSSAKGTKEDPGKRVKAKSGLNKSILDQGWYELRRQLEYKSSWRGGIVVTVAARNTSRKCSVCGYTDAENRKTQAVFACVQCGFSANADWNASINILAAGRAVVACGDISSVAS